MALPGMGIKVLDFLATTKFVDLVLAGVLIEALVLLALHRRTGRGPAPAGLVVNLCAGAGLLGAVRVALAGAAGAWIAVCLSIALLAHLADLRMRWQGAGPGRCGGPR